MMRAYITATGSSIEALKSAGRISRDMCSETAIPENSVFQDYTPAHFSILTDNLQHKIRITEGTIFFGNYPFFVEEKLLDFPSADGKYRLLITIERNVSSASLESFTTSWSLKLQNQPIETTSTEWPYGNPYQAVIVLATIQISSGNCSNSYKLFSSGDLYLPQRWTHVYNPVS